jgi:phage shock protein A
MVCKMMKKGVVGAALGAGILALAFGTSAPSYVKTAFHKARTSVKGSVPVEFEIDRARNEIAALKPAIDEAIEAVVKAEFEVGRLEKEIVATREELNREGQDLQALNDHLKKGDLHLTGGAAYSEKDLKSLTAQKLDHYKLVKSTLANKQETLVIRQKNVTSARKGLDALKTAKRDLSTRLEGIQARLNQINATRSASEFVYDDSAVGRAKQTVSDLEVKLEQMARIDELKGEFADRGTVSPVDPTRDVSREIDAEFSSAPKVEKTSSEKY